jgi:hypothetical protein
MIMTAATESPARKDQGDDVHGGLIAGHGGLAHASGEGGDHPEGAHLQSGRERERSAQPQGLAGRLFQIAQAATDAEARAVPHGPDVTGERREHDPAGDAGGQRRAVGAHGRGASVTFDQQPIQGHVQKVGGERDDHSRGRPRYALEEEGGREKQQHRRQAEGMHGQRRGRAGGHRRALVQGQKQRFAGEQQYASDRAHGSGQQQPDMPDGAAGLALAGAVALGGDDRGSGEQPDADHHKDHERRQRQAEVRQFRGIGMAGHRRVDGNHDDHAGAGQHGGNG